MGWNKDSDNVLLKIVRFALLKVGGVGTVYSVEEDLVCRNIVLFLEHCM